MTTEPASLDRADSDSSLGSEGKAHSPRPISEATPPDDDAASARSPRRWLLPLLVIVLGVSIYGLLVATREKPKTADYSAPPPLVRVQRVELEPFRLSVSTRGTVKPRTESDLVAEVSGRILSVSPKLVVGGFFETGDELLRLDDREHRIARDRARANVTLRGSEAKLAEAEAERRRQLRERGAASAADLEQFESRALVARASLAEARAALEKAKLDLERTVVRAPFVGRVRERNVDVGRFVSPGTKLGRVFAVDYAEVRLPIQIDDLAFLEGALRADRGAASTSEGSSGLEGAPVQLTGRLGGRDYHWPARLERAEAAIDEQTRMLHVVARVEDPYGRVVHGAGESSDAQEDAGNDGDSLEDPTPGVVAAQPGAGGWIDGASERPRADGVVSESIPLPSGLFVHAEIEGRLVSDVAVLPLMALRDGDRVFVFEPAPTEESEGIDSSTPSERGLGERELSAGEGWLRVRPVSVLRRYRDRVVIDQGLEAGERVLISPLRIHSDGMRLRAVEARTS